MTTIDPNKTCLHCSRLVKGRSDKKFCDDYCRNGYHNNQKSTDSKNMRRINYALGKNRRILDSLMASQDEVIHIHRDELLNRGYHFRYCTHTYTNKKGNTYFFCYDLGYLELEGGRCLIVRRKEPWK